MTAAELRQLSGTIRLGCDHCDQLRPLRRTRAGGWKMSEYLCTTCRAAAEKGA